MQVKKYINTISAFQFFQLVRYSTLILIGVVFTKTSLTQGAIGEYETFVFISGAVSFFWLNGLLKALLPISRETVTKTNVFSAFVTLQIFSLAAALFLYFLNPLFSTFLLNGKSVPEIWLLMIFIIFSTPANLVEYFYLLKKKNNPVILYAIISFSVQLLLVVLPPCLGYGIQFALKGLVLSSILRYAWLLGVLTFYKELHFSFAFVKKHLKLGGPLVTATLLSGSAQFVDGFIVTSKFDETTFAVFRYGARELPLAMLLANALNSALLPEFGIKQDLIQNLEKLKMNVRNLMHFLFPLTAVFLLVSHPLFPVIFNPEFEKSATVFNIYLLLVISRLLMPQTILNGLQYSREILAASFLELVINVTLSLLLVNFWGISGVAFATFIAFLFEKIFLVYKVENKLKIRISQYLPVKFYILYSLGTVLIFIFAELIF